MTPLLFSCDQPRRSTGFTTKPGQDYSSRWQQMGAATSSAAVDLLMTGQHPHLFSMLSSSTGLTSLTFEDCDFSVHGAKTKPYGTFAPPMQHSVWMHAMGHYPAPVNASGIPFFAPVNAAAAPALPRFGATHSSYSAAALVYQTQLWSVPVSARGPVPAHPTPDKSQACLPVWCFWQRTPPTPDSSQQLEGAASGRRRGRADFLEGLLWSRWGGAVPTANTPWLGKSTQLESLNR